MRHFTGSAQLNTDGEVRDPTLVSGRKGHIARNDFDEFGARQPRTVVGKIAQQFRHPLIRLRSTRDRHQLILLSQGREVNAIRQLSRDLVQEMDRHVPVGLQIFNGLLPGPQRGNFSLQGGDVLDLRFQSLDFRLQELIPATLTRNLRFVPDIDQTRHQRTKQGRSHQGGVEMFLPTLARGLTVRQQVDENH